MRCSWPLLHREERQRYNHNEYIVEKGAMRGWDQAAQALLQRQSLIECTAAFVRS